MGNADKTIKYSAQAIILDKDNNFYLERNKKIGSLSFVGGAIEQGETPSEALRREIAEELEIIVPENAFVFPEEQTPTIFPTGAWISTYYIFAVDKILAKKISQCSNIEVYTKKDLESLSESELPIDRTRFLHQIQRALDSFTH